MMKTTRAVLAAFLIAIPAGADAAEELRLKIVTYGNAAVAGATVTLGYTTRRTDDSGVMYADVPAEGEYQVTVIHNGSRYFCDVSTDVDQNTCMIRNR